MDVINSIIQFMGNVDPIAAICIIVGTVLIIIEMFTPGFAVPGISGLILLILGIIFTASSFTQGLVIFLLIMAILTLVLVLVIRISSKGKAPLINKNSETAESGYISTKDMQVFVGRQGKAITPLRPAGTCDFDGVRLDVVTEGDFIDKDSKVTINKVEGRRIVVSKIK